MSKQFEDIAARHDRLKSLHVGILVFPGVEVLDFAAPFEGFSVASRVSRRDFGIEPFKVSLIGARWSTTGRLRPRLSEGCRCGQSCMLQEPAHFRRLFKKRIGITSKQLRRHPDDFQEEN